MKNRKIIKKCVITTLLATTVCAQLSLASCKSKTVNDENTVEIYVFQGGYGTEFLESTAKKFEELNPGKTITVKGDSVQAKADAMIKAGPSVTTTDLFFTTDSIAKWVDSGDRLVKGYDCAIESLNDVYEHKLADGTTIAEKMHPSFVENAKYTSYDDEGNETTNYYSFPWSGGITGIIYNKTFFDEINAREPRTSDELFEISDRLKDAGKTPFISSVSTGYTAYLYYVWHAQYEGYQGYVDFWDGRVTGEDERSVNIFKQEGRLHAIQAVEEILSPDKGRIHEHVNSLNFANAQVQLYLGNATMMVNGDWYENEMKLAGYTDTTYTLQFMKTPILSAIKNKTQTIPTDAVLREVVSYVDGETESAPQGVSNEDIELIRKARSVVYTIALNHNAYIPSYATAKETAKEFLKFLATQEAWDIYYETTSGANLPFDYEISDSKKEAMTAFQQSKYQIYNTATMLPMQTKFPLCYNGGLLQWSGNRSNIEVPLASIDPSTKKTGREMFDDEISAHNNDSFRSMLVRAGLM